MIKTKFEVFHQTKTNSNTMLTMNKITTYAFCLLTLISTAQQTIVGTVTDTKNQPIVGANVYLEGTYDGATTDETGVFSFTTDETGTQKLIVSYLSYETSTIEGDISNMKALKVKLKDNVDALDTVVISAGTFEANDNSKVSVLKPLDVVTTASAVGDFVGALQTLPGTTTVAEDGRLFVRGGDAEETQIFIDGIRVFTPYTPTANNTPTRGRYSPFLFDGITFSTGGYSAEYGNALSSVLLLNTIDEPDQEKTDLGIMSVGGMLGHSEKWNTTSLSINASYFNLAPYVAVFPDRNDWIKPYEAAQGESVFRQKFESGWLKWYAAFDKASFELIQDDINNPDGFYVKLNNGNFYTNVSYCGLLKQNWAIETGMSYTIANTKTKLSDFSIKDKENSAHLKLKLKKRFSSRFKWSFGAEHFITDFKERYDDDSFDTTYGFTNNNTAVFSEGDIIFSKSFAMKLGLRGDYYGLSEEFKLAPRASLAYKTSEHGQLSVAFGDFYQNVPNTYLKFDSDLQTQNTAHYILNYQWVKDNRILRAEVYRKAYDNLLKYDTEIPEFDSQYSNTGNGYAQGLDLFWRDNASIKNTDYWLSYSYLDTKRNYQNFPEQATPNFANKHNFSAVAKHWIEDWKSQLGFSYTFASGRPYTDPNTNQFLSEKTKAYNSISVNWAYLISQQKILYVSVNNILGFKNINGYQYANTPDMNGNFQRQALLPAADQFFFVGFFWTISDNKTDNQLDNL